MGNDCYAIDRRNEIELGEEMTDEQIKKYHNKVEDNIKKYGYHVTFVFAGSTPSFCYSTGIYKSFGIPEIFISSLPQFISSLPQNLSHGLIESYVNKFKNLDSIPVDTRIDDLTDRFPIYLIDISTNKLTDYALSSFRFYKNEDSKYVQLIYPDTEGHFPNDEGYNYDQIVMGQFMS